MYTHILIRFGELSTKGKNKMTFVRKLASNIENLLKIKLEINFDRIFMNYSKNNLEKLKYIFGISSYSPVVEVKTDDEEVNKVILNLIKNKQGKTFKAFVKKSYKKYEKSSMERAADIGSLILKNNNLKVDVKNPDIKIEVEIREKKSFVFVDRVIGLGGYPTGVNGKVIHLISGGIDSPVAAYEMMKRGIHVDFVNFVSPPHTDDLTINKVNKIIKVLLNYQGKATLYRSNYIDLMNYIGLVSNQAYKITLMRRSFYRIVSNLALKNNYLGISNGENVGQVASQTLESMHVIQKESSFPIYRPILTNDKLETIKKGEEIGTYEISIEKGNETCELFAPKNPIIKPKIWNLEKLENELDKLKELEEENIKNQIEILKFKL